MVYVGRLCVRLSVCRPSIQVFSFPVDNLSKYEWMFTKFEKCIDIVEIWLGIANRQILSIFISVTCPSICCPSVRLYFRFRMITWVNVNGFSPNLVCALILWRSGLGSLMGKFSSNFDRVIFPHTIVAGYYRFMFLCTIEVYFFWRTHIHVCARAHTHFGMVFVTMERLKANR